MINVWHLHKFHTFVITILTLCHSIHLIIDNWNASLFFSENKCHLLIFFNRFIASCDLSNNKKHTGISCLLLIYNSYVCFVLAYFVSPFDNPFLNPFSFVISSKNRIINFIFFTKHYNDFVLSQKLGLSSSSTRNIFMQLNQLFVSKIFVQICEFIELFTVRA